MHTKKRNKIDVDISIDRSYQVFLFAQGWSSWSNVNGLKDIQVKSSESLLCQPKDCLLGLSMICFIYPHQLSPPSLVSVHNILIFMELWQVRSDNRFAHFIQFLLFISLFMLLIIVVEAFLLSLLIISVFSALSKFCTSNKIFKYLDLFCIIKNLNKNFMKENCISFFIWISRMRSYEHRRRTINSCRLNKWFSFEFPAGYSDQYTPGEGWRAQWPKYCDNCNKDEDNSPNINSVFPLYVSFYELWKCMCMCVCVC